MADIVQSIDELEIIIASVINNFNLADAVEISYAHQGATTLRDGQNKIYLSLAAENSDISGFMNIQTEEVDNQIVERSYQYTRRLRLNVSCYGEKCFEIATMLRKRFFFNSSQVTFRKNNLYIVSKTDTDPQTIRENYNGQWWKRSDIQVLFDNPVMITENVGKITCFNIKIKGNK